MFNADAFLTALAAQPKTHRITTIYECGKVRTFDAHGAAAAANFAARESRKIGRGLIERETGKTVQVASVSTEYLA